LLSIAVIRNRRLLAIDGAVNVAVALLAFARVTAAPDTCVHPTFEIVPLERLVTAPDSVTGVLKPTVC